MNNFYVSKDKAKNNYDLCMKSLSDVDIWATETFLILKENRYTSENNRLLDKLVRILNIINE